MTPEEYKEANDQLWDVVRQRDAAQNSALVWKLIAGLLAFLIIFLLADKWGWI
jgi:hypothetical protein